MKLFDIMFGKMIDRRVSEYQSDLIEKHCEEVQHIYKTMRGWRHDYHNHMEEPAKVLERKLVGTKTPMELFNRKW